MVKLTIHKEAHPDFNVEHYDYRGAFDAQWSVKGPGAEEMRAAGLATNTRELLKQICGDKAPMVITQCAHCGQRIRYFALMYHTGADEFVTIGEICLDNRFEHTHAQFKALRDAAKEQAKAVRAAGKLNLFIEAHPDFAKLIDQYDNNEIYNAYGRSSEFVADVIFKLKKYSELSDAQVNAVRKAVEREQVWQAKRAQERETLKPAPVGRMKITGTVVGLKTEEGYGYYSVPIKKMLVMADGNFKVYGTVPSGLGDVEKGQRVEFTATLTQSKNDATFAIAKRPVA